MALLFHGIQAGFVLFPLREFLLAHLLLNLPLHFLLEFLHHVEFLQLQVQMAGRHGSIPRGGQSVVGFERFVNPRFHHGHVVF